MPVAKFRIINSSLSGQEFSLPAHPVIVGRSETNDIVIPDPSVSRQHVRAELKNGRCVLTDLGSHNGIVLNGETLREAVLSTGDRFELGDVAIEFRVEEDEPAPLPAFMLARPASVNAAAGAVPAERPVYVDDVFGPAAEQPSLGPGEAERSAVQGARGAVRFALFLLVLVGLGVVAWRLAGSGDVEPDIRPVVVEVGERKVIDLGMRVRKYRGRLIPYIDKRERYRPEDIIEEPASNIAMFELDSSQFMATVEGIDLGSTDVKLAGPGGRVRTVRIVVSGVSPRVVVDERLKPEERLARAQFAIEAGKQAAASGYIYNAITRFNEARSLLEPIRSGSGAALYRQAEQLYDRYRETINTRFENIKRQALARYYERDLPGALLEWQRLRELIPAPDDERNQKLKIIHDRTVMELRRGG